MKKLLTLAALAGAASISFGQGEVNFANSTTTRIATSATIGGPSTAFTSTTAGSFYYALFVAPTTVTTSLQGTMTDPTTVGWIFTGNVATNTTSPGRLSGNYNPDTSVSVSAGPIHNPGDTGNFMVVGWSSDNGTTWASAQTKLNGGTLGGFWGESLVALNVTAQGGAISAPNIFGTQGTANGQLPGFVLSPVPEPSTFALAGLGAATLLIFRRRK